MIEAVACCLIPRRLCLNSVRPTVFQRVRVNPGSVRLLSIPVPATSNPTRFNNGVWSVMLILTDWSLNLLRDLEVTCVRVHYRRPAGSSAGLAWGWMKWFWCQIHYAYSIQDSLRMYMRRIIKKPVREFYWYTVVEGWNIKVWFETPLKYKFIIILLEWPFEKQIKASSTWSFFQRHVSSDEWARLCALV